jgi:hypothetical protein
MNKKLKQLKEIAQRNNAELLSTEWICNDYAYLFKSKSGKIIKINYLWIKKFGFPEEEKTIIKKNLLFKDERCKTGGKYRKTPKEYLENLKLFVKENHNGELISTEWKNYKKTNYIFKDKFGIIFERTAVDVLHNKLWTPNKKLMAEPITKQVFEHLFQVKFEKTNSILIRKITGQGCWELDGYNEELKIAFEYQGFSSHWNINDIKYEETYKRDILKNDLCKKLGIFLIQIPTYNDYILRNFKDEEVFNHVLNQIKRTFNENNIELPQLNSSVFKINFNLIPYAESQLKKISDFLKINNAILLSTEYKGNDHKYKFKDMKTEKDFESTWKELKKFGYKNGAMLKLG